MTAVPAPSCSTWDELVQTWQRLDLPNEAWRAEIIEEAIVMTPPSAPAHNAIAARVQRALDRAISDERGVVQALGVAMPLRRCLFVPDIAVIPFGEIDGARGPVPVDRALLIAEITSKGSANIDREQKLRAYGHAEVPLYLVIDQFAEDGPAAFLHSEPHDGSCGKRERFPFGKPIELPAPFDLTIPTDEF